MSDSHYIPVILTDVCATGLDGRKKRKKKEGWGAGILIRWCLFSFFSFFFYFINRHDLSIPASLCLCVFA